MDKDLIKLWAVGLLAAVTLVATTWYSVVSERAKVEQARQEGFQAGVAHYLRRLVDHTEEFKAVTGGILPAIELRLNDGDLVYQRGSRCIYRIFSTNGYHFVEQVHIKTNDVVSFDASSVMLKVSDSEKHSGL